MTVYSLPGYNTMTPYGYSRFNNANIQRPADTTAHHHKPHKKNNTGAVIASTIAVAALAFLGRKKVGPLIEKLGQLLGKGGTKVSELGQKFAKIEVPQSVKSFPGKIKKAAKGAWEGIKKRL